MSNLARLADYRPSPEGMERRVADTDDGYTRIANELLEAVMSADLTARQLKIVLAVIRKTYGFGKKLDRITNTQIAAMTGIHHTHVCTAKNEMIAMNILISSGNQICVNKVVSEWNSCISQLSETLAKSANKSLAKSANEHSPSQLNTKETITKEKKENKNTMSEQVQTACEKASKPANKYQEIDQAFESVFWSAGMVKKGKQKAISAFRSQFQEWRKESRGTPEQFAQMLAEDIACRKGKQFGFDNLHPATYLNGQRWNDDKPIPETPQAKSSSTITVSKTGYVFFDR
ncbi:replication protein [Cronobacter sakazakii]|nr:replication protein [Cronobacter sakazakii]